MNYLAIGMVELFSWFILITFYRPDYEKFVEYFTLLLLVYINLTLQFDVKATNGIKWLHTNTTAVCNPRQISVQDKKISPRQNPVWDKIGEKYFLSEKKLSETEKKLSQMLSRVSSAQSELSLTNQCLSSLSSIFIPQQDSKLLTAIKRTTPKSG